MKKTKYRLKRGNEPVREMLLQDAADFLGVTTQTICSANKRDIEVRGWTIQSGEVMELRISRKCADCGNRFQTQKSTLYCEDCRRKRKNQPVGAEKKLKRNTGEVPYEKKSPLSKAAWDARQAGMSYGRYTGLQYQKVEKRSCTLTAE